MTALAVAPFVYYARVDLEIGPGFRTAIQVCGGDSIEKELQGNCKLDMKVKQLVNLTASTLVVPESKNREVEPENSAIKADPARGPA